MEYENGKMVFTCVDDATSVMSEALLLTKVLLDVTDGSLQEELVVGGVMQEE